MSRAAFLSAFADEVKQGNAHLFYVLFTKSLPIDERRRIMSKSSYARRAFAKTMPAELAADRYEVSRQMMKESLKHGRKIGKWGDDWFDSPVPTMNEPEKTMSWMTPDDSINEDRKADMYLRAGLARVDNTFQKARRLVNGFERPIETQSTGAKWQIYQPYNPAIIQTYLTYLTIYRTYNNFVLPGDDGKTPAMRLGLTKIPLEIEDILWPDQKVPQPKRRRRKGRKLTV